ncbi:hypothetical protein ACHAPU_011370 [Fusarium lateritium]
MFQLGSSPSSGIKEEGASSMASYFTAQERTPLGSPDQTSYPGPSSSNDRMPPMELLNYPLPDYHPCYGGRERTDSRVPDEQVSSDDYQEDCYEVCCQDSLENTNPASTQGDGPSHVHEPYYELEYSYEDSTCSTEYGDPTSVHPPYGTVPGYEYRVSFTSDNSEVNCPAESQHPQAEEGRPGDYARYYGEQLASSSSFGGPRIPYQQHDVPYDGIEPSVMHYQHYQSLESSTSHSSGSSSSYHDGYQYQALNTSQTAPYRFYCQRCRAEMEREEAHLEEGMSTTDNTLPPISTSRVYTGYVEEDVDERGLCGRGRDLARPVSEANDTRRSHIASDWRNSFGIWDEGRE